MTPVFCFSVCWVGEKVLLVTVVSVNQILSRITKEHLYCDMGSLPHLTPSSWDVFGDNILHPPSFFHHIHSSLLSLIAFWFCTEEHRLRFFFLQHASHLLLRAAPSVLVHSYCKCNHHYYWVELPRFSVQPSSRSTKRKYGSTHILSRKEDENAF